MSLFLMAFGALVLWYLYLFAKYADYIVAGLVTKIMVESYEEAMKDE